MKHNRVIRQEFSKQAARFGEKGLTLSSQDLLDWIVTILPLNPELRVLDVAAGTGHLSRAIAPHVREVVAVDITPAMLEVAQAEIKKDNFGNISLEEGSAERIPHPADCFDLVASRLAVHHFEKPILLLQEMVRVCKPNHRVGIIDLLASEDEKIAQTYNELERLRDPSHTVALSKTQMVKLLDEAGIAIETIEVRDVEVDFQRWAQMTGTKPETIEIIQEALRIDMNGGAKTGMRPHIDNGVLKFLHVWSVMIGRKHR